MCILERDNCSVDSIFAWLDSSSKLDYSIIAKCWIIIILLILMAVNANYHNFHNQYGKASEPFETHI